MGAVADGGTPLIVRNEDVIAMSGVGEREFDAVCQRELAEIERRRAPHLGARVRPKVRGHIAIVVDDGVATGATTRAALRAVRARHPRKLVLAVPVAPPDTLESLRVETDETICLETHEDFGAIPFFLRRFPSDRRRGSHCDFRWASRRSQVFGRSERINASLVISM